MRRIFSGVIILSLLAGLTGCGEIRARQAMQRGITLYKANKYEKAAEEFKFVVEKKPGWSEAWLNRGYSCKQAFIPSSTSERDKGFADCAIESFKTYLEQTPAGKARDNAVEFLITVFLDARRHDAALAYFVPLHESEPSEINHVKSIREIYRSKGDFDNTVLWLNKELTLSTEGKEITYYTLCSMYEYKVRPMNAASVMLTPDEKFDYMAKGIAYCDEAMKLKADYAEAFVFYSLLHRWRSRLDGEESIAEEENNKPKSEELKLQQAADIQIAEEYKKKAETLNFEKRKREALEKGLPPPPTPGAAPVAPVPAPLSTPATPGSIPAPPPAPAASAPVKPS